MIAVATPVNVLVAGLLGVLAAATATAQTVYQCGPHGSVYSQFPCDAGRVVDVADPRSPQQQEDARKVGAAQSRLALQIANERRASQRAQPPAYAAGIDYPAATAAQAKVRSVNNGTVGQSGKKDNAGNAAITRTRSRPAKALQAANANRFVAIGPGATTGNNKRNRVQD